MQMALTQAIRRASQVNRNGVATVFEDRTRTWTEFENRVARLAAGIKGLGVDEGDRVALLAPITPTGIWNISSQCLGQVACSCR